MKQVFICTNSTGLLQENEDRLIEVGAIEVKDRELTGRHFHCYVNPSTRGKGFAVFHPTLRQRRCVGGMSG
ncbi:hypothetical protein G7015_10130 [Pseudomonas kunmingensis]|nr:hypothetical protein [Stutzerimonas kunmingensis]